MIRTGQGVTPDGPFAQRPPGVRADIVEGMHDVAEADQGDTASTDLEQDGSRERKIVEPTGTHAWHAVYCSRYDAVNTPELRRTAC